jgi:hypothetical protein
MHPHSQSQRGLSFLQLEEEQYRPDDKKWDDEGCSAKKNVVKPNSLDDKSKMIFFCWQTISCFVNITGRLLT